MVNVSGLRLCIFSINKKPERQSPWIEHLADWAALEPGGMNSHNLSENPSRWISKAYLQLTFSTPKDRSVATFLSFALSEWSLLKTSSIHLLVCGWRDDHVKVFLGRQMKGLNWSRQLAEQVWQLSRTPGTVWMWEEYILAHSAHTQWWSRLTF